MAIVGLEREVLSGKVHPLNPFANVANCCFAFFFTSISIQKTFYNIWVFSNLLLKIQIKGWLKTMAQTLQNFGGL